MSSESLKTPITGSARHTLTNWSSWVNAEVEFAFTRSSTNNDSSELFQCTTSIKGVPAALLNGNGVNAEMSTAAELAAKSFTKLLFKQQLVTPDFALAVVSTDLDDPDPALLMECQKRWQLFQTVLNKDTILTKNNNQNNSDNDFQTFWTKFNNALSSSRKRKHNSNDGEPAPKKIAFELGNRSESLEDGEITSKSASPVVLVDDGDVLDAGEKPTSSTDKQQEARDSLSPIIDLDAVSNDVDINGVYQSNVVEAGDDEEDVIILDDDDGELPLPPSDVPIDTEHQLDYGIGPKPDYNYDAWRKALFSYKKRFPEEHDLINESIMKHYEVNLQNEDTLSWKNLARQSLELAVRTRYPSAQIYAVGSTMNGCGSYNSDMDLCLVIDDKHLPQKFINEKKRVLEVLHTIRKLIRSQLYLTRKTLVISAVVPILQITFRGSFDKLEVDMNVNNIAGIYNTHLIHHYARLDERFPALCLLVKHWALVANINSAQDGTFNSYSLILLVLHYLQCVAQPPVMPNLQQLHPDVFNGTTPVHELRFHTNVSTFESQNHDDHASLLLGFFHYYHDFDFNEYAISIRKASVFKKKSLGQEIADKYSIYIEEPFDRNNTARCARHNGFEAIKIAFRRAYKSLWQSKKKGLERIGVHVKF